MYLVSSHGRVKRVGGLRRPSREFMKGSYDKDGYVSVALRDVTRYSLLRVHRLVAMAFVDGFSPELQVAHLDGSRTNNAATNLKWTTAKENNDHRKIHGTDFVGERHPCALLKESDIPEIFAYKKRGFRSVDIAGAYGVDASTIGNILSRHLWTHVKIPTESQYVSKPRPVIGEEKVRKILELRRSNYAVSDIAMEVGVSRVTAYKILNSNGVKFNS